ncbi:MAG: 50S ribosomal protein L1 [Candidatus Schekmanbacteria bacterium]|nr:50S ribosomal protein L1 [Candidatus Schekmanbacteria bacterium]
MHTGKKYSQSKGKAGKAVYSVENGVKAVKECAYAKFDETVDVVVRLGVDPRHAEQMVRGTVVLPHGTGKAVKILVLAKGEKEKEAQANGADWVGCDEYIEKINGGWLECDRIIATPDVMGTVSKLGRILGPRGLMPNPKTGTVTFDIARAIQEIKKGQITFKVDKFGNLHAAVGKVSFSAEALKENVMTFLETIVKMKPASSKGQYLKGVTISSTMGPGIKLDLIELRSVLRA